MNLVKGKIFHNVQFRSIQMTLPHVILPRFVKKLHYKLILILITFQLNFIRKILKKKTGKSWRKQERSWFNQEKSCRKILKYSLESHQENPAGISCKVTAPHPSGCIFLTCIWSLLKVWKELWGILYEIPIKRNL